MNEYSREKIKLRMLKRIAMLWDISDIEHVDPVVRLLIEAMAEEIFTLAGEIGNLDDRLLSKLSASMTPVPYLTARPAHAILSAMPIDPIVTIDRDTFFEYKESSLLRRYNLNNIFFAPIVPFDLVKANIRFVNVESRLYKYTEGCRKHIIGYAQGHDEGLNSNVWLGIEVSPEIISLERLSFYFDFLNVEGKMQYLQSLPYTQWTVAGKEARFEQGLAKADVFAQPNYRKEQTEVIFSDLHAIYDTHYVTLKDIDTSVKENYPKEWDAYYSEDVLAQFAEPLLWIKITFPPSVPGEMLDYLRVGINLFPVANMFRKTSVQQMTDVSMFMPLNTGGNECFVEIETVRDSSGKMYDLLSPGDYQEVNKERGVYSLRRGGVEQCSRTNDAKSAILRLADIIRDRNMFSNSKAEAEFHQMVDSILSSTNKISNAVEALGKTTEAKSYIIVDRGVSGESLIAEYWVTSGDAINNFKPVVPLIPRLCSSGALKEENYFLTPVQGGTSMPSIDQVKDIHRYMLTTCDRIFTKHDILNYCRAEYGLYIKDIEIKPGVAVGRRPTQGLVKTIDIHITMVAARIPRLSNEDFKLELQCKLEKRSPENFNYRIFINK